MKTRLNSAAMDSSGVGGVACDRHDLDAWANECKRWLEVLTIQKPVN